MVDYSIRLIVPEIFLFLWALFIFAFDLGTKRKKPELLGYLTLGGIAATAVLLAIYKGGISKLFSSVPRLWQSGHLFQ
jgi:hypothetical protein